DLTGGTSRSGTPNATPSGSPAKGAILGGGRLGPASGHENRARETPGPPATEGGTGTRKRAPGRDTLLPTAATAPRSATRWWRHLRYRRPGSPARHGPPALSPGPPGN